MLPAAPPPVVIPAVFHLLSGKPGNTGDIAAGARQAINETSRDRVLICYHDDRDRLGSLLGGSDR